MSFGNSINRNNMFETLGKTSSIMELIKQAENSIYNIELNFMLEPDATKIVKKVNKHINRLYDNIAAIQKEAVNDFQKLNLKNKKRQNKKH